MKDLIIGNWKTYFGPMIYNLFYIIYLELRDLDPRCKITLTSAPGSRNFAQ